jgi:hypothetical protein
MQNSGFNPLGDRARYPFKLRNMLLVTTSIVVAVLKQTKPQSTSTTAVFFYRPYP